MSRLLEPEEIVRSVELVTREANALLVRARAEHEKVKQARATGNGVAERLALGRLARIARQFTRAQAVLVHADDPRAAAAKAVIGYCDEADTASPWAEAQPVRLGVAS